MKPLVLLICIVGLAACSDSSDTDISITAAAEPGLPGPFGVGHTTFTAIDPARNNRSLVVDVWYPVDEEDRQLEPVTIYELGGGFGLPSSIAVDDLPVSGREDQVLLVFSHGLGGVSTASVDLMEILASHGFIVISPEHTGNSQMNNFQSFDEAAASRVPDVTFLIDAMIARSEDAADMFAGRIRADRVGVLGHSFGGMTSLGMASGWAGAPPDPRVKAIVPASAVVRAELQEDERSGPNAGFTREQLERITIPAMLIGGTEDTDVFIENNSIAFAEMINAPDLFQVDFIGANHNHFISNLCDIGNLLIDLGILQDSWPLIGAEELLVPYDTTCTEDAFPIDEVVRVQNVYTVAFFKRYLLDDQRYDLYLADEYANSEPNVTFSGR